VLSVLLALAVVFVAWKGASISGLVASDAPVGKYDSFAKCLTEKGVTMYGAYWCPHCQNQKDMFGESWQFVNYIECSLPNRGGQTKVCADEKITGYPTWDINGVRKSGELSLQQLSELSGCALSE
jgi:hypothetical protein